MKNWKELEFECVDEGRPVFIKNGNAYALVVRDGKEQMRSISNLTVKEKDELLLNKLKIEEFEKWAKDVFKSSTKAKKKNEQLNKREEVLALIEDLKIQLIYILENPYYVFSISELCDFIDDYKLEDSEKKLGCDE